MLMVVVGSVSRHTWHYVEFGVVYWIIFCLYFFFFFKQKTAYEMRISDWSSDVCSSDLRCAVIRLVISCTGSTLEASTKPCCSRPKPMAPGTPVVGAPDASLSSSRLLPTFSRPAGFRSEEHTSELQSLMRNSYSVFCLTKKKICTKKATCNK